MSFSAEERREYLSRRIESDDSVCLSTVNGRTLALKTIPDYDCREYHVGMALNELKHPNIIKTLDRWLDENGDAWLVFDYIDDADGEDDKFIGGRAPTDAEIAIDLTVILDDINSKRKFCTYDRRPTNYLVEPLKKWRTFTYQVNGETVAVKSDYRIVMINFEFAYLEGVSPPKELISINMLRLGVVPWVYDPYYDYFTIVSWVYRDEEFGSDSTEEEIAAVAPLRQVYRDFSFHLFPEVRQHQITYYRGRPCYKDWKPLREYSRIFDGMLESPSVTKGEPLNVRVLEEAAMSAHTIEEKLRARLLLFRYARACKMQELRKRPETDPRFVLLQYLESKLQ